MNSLSSLPAEILCHVAHYLATPSLRFSDDGLLNLRLTSRSIRRNIQYTFARAAFSTLIIDLHPEALQRWLTICSSSDFGKAVRRVIFTRSDDKHIVFPHVEEKGFERFEDQVLFVLSSIFNDAFTQMVNLKEVVIVPPCVARFRKHHIVPTTASGTRESFKLKQVSITVERLWELVAQTVAETGTPLWSLQVTRTCVAQLTHRFTAYSLSGRAFAATPTCIELLAVTVDARNDSLGRTLNTMSHLTALDLSFSKDGLSYVPENCAVSLATIQSLQHVCLPNLSSLALRGAVFEIGVLRKMLLSHKTTLESLLLYSISLPSGGWHAIFTLLLDEFQGLEELHLRGLRVGTHYHYPWSGRIDLVGRLLVMQGLSEQAGRL